VQFGKNRHYIGNTIVTSTQPRNQLGNKRSQDDKIPTIMWKKYKVQRRAESKKRKKSSNIKREKDSEIGNR